MSFTRLLLAIVCAAAGCFVTPVAAGAQPNIVWIVAEDMSPDLACYGREQVHTPHLDKLAGQGMRFTQAFATNPLCSSSRSAFITGIYQTTLGAHHQRMPEHLAPTLPDDVKTLPQLLRALGYHTVNARKINAGLTGSGKNDWNFKATDENQFDSRDGTDLPQRQPFFVQINFKESHRPFNSPDHADRSKVDLPPYYPDHPVAREDFAGYLDDVTALDVKVGKVLDWLETENLRDNTVVIFFADHGRPMTRGKQWNYDSGLHVPLIIHWPAGLNSPAEYRHGTVSDELVSLIDLTATTIRAAGGTIPSNMHGRPLFDPEVKPRDAVFAASDRDGECILKIRSVRTARYLYLRNGHPDKPAIYATAYRKASHPMYHLLTKLGAEGRLNNVQRALIEPRAPEELYDVVNDPHQIHNLAGSPEHADVLNALRGRLDHWIKTTDDKGQLPDSEAVVEHFKAYGEKSAKSRGPHIEKRRKQVYEADEKYLRNHRQ